MAKPQHRTREHREAKASLARLVAAGAAYCVEPMCLWERDGYGRWIPSDSTGDQWHVCHDTTGTVITGPGHAVCNLTEAAIRGRAKQLAGHRAWTL